MSATPLAIFGARSTLGRLRRESGCLRLERGEGLAWVELETLSDLLACSDERAGVDGSFKRTPEYLENISRLGRLIWGDDPVRRTFPVLVWEAGSGMSLPAVDVLTRRLGAALQADKVETSGQRGLSDRIFSFKVLVAIIPCGLDGLGGQEARETARVLNLWSGQEVGTALRQSIPVYLMTECNRIDGDRRWWPAARVWPVAVGRLLSSLLVAPVRTAGLRAWRSYALAGSPDELDPIAMCTRRAALRIVNYNVERSSSEPSSNDLAGLEQVRYPSRDVNVKGQAPAHPRDSFSESQDEVRLRLPDWWRLRPGDSSSESIHRDASIHYHRRVRTEFTPGRRKGSGNEWDERMQASGHAFRLGRSREDEEDIQNLLGNGSLHVWAWRTIHQDPVWVELIRGNGFLCRDGAAPGRFTDCLRRDLNDQRTSQMDPGDPGNIQTADDERARRIESARAVTHHLEKARLHFVSLGWRFACALAAAVFASALIGNLPIEPVRRSAGGGDLGWAAQVGLWAASGAAVSSLLLLALEISAGMRATNRAEVFLCEAENRIAQAFQRRLDLVRRGLNLRRHTLNLQAAARAADGAQRLKMMMDLDTSDGVPEVDLDVSSDDPQEVEMAKEYQRATTGILRPPLTSAVLEQVLFESDPNWLQAEADAYLAWWRDSMGEWDPRATGSIRERDFMQAYRGRWREVHERLGSRFRICAAAYLQARTDQVNADAVHFWVGGGSDVPGLSCLTERAAGRLRRRWMHILAPSRGLGNSLAAEVRSRVGGDAAILISVEATDGWGGLVLMVDEIDIVLLPPSEARVDGILDKDVPARWRIMEGRRPDLKVAAAIGEAVGHA
jgi:hypothetical protein